MFFSYPQGFFVLGMLIWLYHKLDAICNMYQTRSYFRGVLRIYDCKDKTQPAYTDADSKEVARLIIGQMSFALDQQTKSVTTHAGRHKAILFRTTLWLPTHIADPALYKGIEIVKHMFYETYGTFLSSEGNGLRNHCDIAVITANRQDLTPYIHRQPLERIIKVLSELRLDDPSNRDGCYLGITMSMPSPIANRHYNYRRFPI